MKSVLQKEVFRPSEVAGLCGVTRNTVYRWIRQKVFLPVTLGGCTYIRGRDLRAHLNGDSEFYEQPNEEGEEDLEQEAQEMLLSFRGHR